MNWMVNELKPYIDGNFRTLPDRRNTILAGSSMGGLMALYDAAADILRSPETQARMKQGMAQLGIPDAAERIYDTVMALVR